MELWKRLEDELNSIGKNWRWLGKISAVPESTLSRWRDKGKYPSVEKCVNMANAVGRSVEYLVTGLEGKYADFSELTLKIAAAAEQLDETGKLEALNLVQSLEKFHPHS